MEEDVHKERLRMELVPGYKNSEKPFVPGKYIFAIPIGIEKLRT